MRQGICLLVGVLLFTITARTAGAQDAVQVESPVRTRRSARIPP
jgi:hypothetical protein